MYDITGIRIIIYAYNFLFFYYTCSNDHDHEVCFEADVLQHFCLLRSVCARTCELRELRRVGVYYNDI